AQPAGVVALPAGDDVHVLLHGRGADGGIIPVAPAGDGREVDVVDAPAHERAQSALLHRARARIAVTVVVDDGRRSRAQEVPGAEPRQEVDLFGAEAVALWYAGRVHRREVHVLDHAPGDDERGVIVRVHEPGHDDAAARVDPHERGEAGAGDGAGLD